MQKERAVNALVPTTWTPPAAISPKKVGETVASFLDVATTSFGRATHYNTREEQQAAELKVHGELLALDRTLYDVLMLLPGLTDRSRQVALKNLLSSPLTAPGFAPAERAILTKLFHELPPQRMLKIVLGFRVGDQELGLKKANNARTRKLILRTILNSEKLMFWAVKYRSKMRVALTHAWGERMTGIIRSILHKDDWTQKEVDIIRKNVCRYLKDDSLDEELLQSLAFILGVKLDQIVPIRAALRPLIRAFYDAKENLEEGKSLPIEVLEGIRGTYHKDVPKAKILELKKDTLTKGQKLQVQRRAEEAGVQVEMNPLDYDMVRLYLYAFERGMTEDIQKALETKAKALAQMFPLKFKRVGILVDGSASMAGDKTQALRPLAIALATRDTLKWTAEGYSVEYVGGGEYDPVSKSLKPAGDTNLAEAFVYLLDEQAMPDAIFIISDGYENRPAGRIGEVIAHLRGIGMEVPIYHFNPVFAAEAKSLKALSDSVSMIPVRSPEALGTGFLREALHQNPVEAIQKLFQIARNALEGGNDVDRRAIA